MKDRERTTVVRTMASRTAIMVRLLAVAIVLTTALAAAGGPRLEAEAAGAGAVKVCVKFQSGDPYRQKPLSLVFANGSVRDGSTNYAQGCGTFYNVPVGADFYVHAAWQSSSGIIYLDSAPDNAMFLELTYDGQLKTINLIVRPL
jgi:hypothetical protein